MQAAILTAKLPFLNEWTERRRAIANIYKKELAGLKNIKLPDEIFGKHVYHQFSILVETKEGLSMRGDLEKFLADRGVGTRIFYPQTLSSIEFLNSCEELRNACPISERVTRSVLALPMWPELEDSQVLYVCEQIRAWDKK
jgi:dTDP-4-amino-4,6-dideoxygalactose transaminase